MARNLGTSANSDVGNVVENREYEQIQTNYGLWL
jgi:hypothetical protein